MNGGTAVARGGAAEGTMVGGDTGIWVLLEGGGEVEFEKFNTGNGHCEVANKDGCETSVGVPFISVDIVEFKRVSGGIVEGTKFVAS